MSERIDYGTRIKSMIVDHLLMVLLLIVLSSIGISFTKFGNISVEHNPQLEITFLNTNFLTILGAVLYLSKDIFGGQSPGKRIFHLQLVTNTSEKPPSPFIHIFRNILFFLWPIELMFLSKNPERRLGDYITGTKVIKINYDEFYETKINYLSIVASIVLWYAFFLFLVIPKDEIKAHFNKIDFIEGSYNVDRSEHVTYVLKEVFNELAGDSIVISSDVRVYDRIKSEADKKFVSIIIHFNEHYFEKKEDFEVYKSATKLMLDELFKEEPYIGMVKFAYKNQKSNLTNIKQFQIK